MAEEVDLNSDGDQADQILQRILVAGGGRVTMGTLNSFDVPAATVGGGGSPKIGAFLTQEAQIGATGKDLNKDGDKTDVVSRRHLLSGRLLALWRGDRFSANRLLTALFTAE